VVARGAIHTFRKECVLIKNLFCPKKKAGYIVLPTSIPDLYPLKHIPTGIIPSATSDKYSIITIRMSNKKWSGEGGQDYHIHIKLGGKVLCKKV